MGKAIKVFNVSEGGGSEGGGIVKGSTPPSDTSLLWFNTNDKIIYFYSGSEWLSEEIFEVVFNDQGTTPNNTFFRVGNTVTSDLGIGYNMPFKSKILGLSFNRAPTTAQIGNFWMYSNEFTGTDFASVVTVFTVSDTSKNGFILPNVSTTISANKYISFRWNGNQTNNNIITLQYRKQY